jgi:GTPase
VEEEIGRIIHYFSGISVGVLNLTLGTLTVGDTIHISGHRTELYQKVRSIQVEHREVSSAGKGILVGLKVDDAVRENDRVYKLIE